MKFSAGIAALVGAMSVAAAPIESEVIEKRNPEGINYVQNYNGGAGNFKNNLGAGTFSTSWNGGTDIVVGIGWSTGSARFVSYISLWLMSVTDK
jgi:endo-1,4-beta-xylanase